MVRAAGRCTGFAHKVCMELRLLSAKLCEKAVPFPVLHPSHSAKKRDSPNGLSLFLVRAAGLEPARVSTGS